MELCQGSLTKASQQYLLARQKTICIICRQAHGSGEGMERSYILMVALSHCAFHQGGLRKEETDFRERLKQC